MGDSGGNTRGGAWAVQRGRLHGGPGHGEMDQPSAISTIRHAGLPVSGLRVMPFSRLVPWRRELFARLDHPDLASTPMLFVQRDMLCDACGERVAGEGELPEREIDGRFGGRQAKQVLAPREVPSDRAEERD